MVPEATEITKEWLADALDRPGDLLSMEATEIGTGQVGTNIRYEMQWDTDPSPTSVVGKFAATDPMSRAAAAQTGTYIKEVGFYRDLQSTVAIPTPEIYFSAEDIEANAFVLLMEDLSASTPGNQLEGCTVAQAALAVEAAAGLHGPHWGDDQLLELSWVQGRDGERAVLHADLYNNVVPGFIDRYQETVRQEVHELAEWLGSRLLTYFTATETPRTLVHGDYRLDNMLFDRNSSASTGHDASGITVVDWQTCALGHGVADIAYFIGGSLTPELRQQAEPELFDLYCDSLSPWVPDLDREALWNDYRLSSVSGLIMAVIASQIVGRTDRGDAMFAAMANRHGQHMVDSNINELLL